MMTILVLAVLIADRTLCLTREQLLQHLKEKQDTRNTFDSRVPRFIQPIGYVDGEPIWPRVLDTVKSEAELFFDDDNFAYRSQRYKKRIEKNAVPKKPWLTFFKWPNTSPIQNSGADEVSIPISFRENMVDLRMSRAVRGFPCPSAIFYLLETNELFMLLCLNHQQFWVISLTEFWLKEMLVLTMWTMLLEKCILSSFMRHEAVDGQLDLLIH
ncbi:unnamed protein product [Angiostrongylus costaricensis]|uniref:Uncharacterized protein n=1 Tax=Angiostrongylus costaricensis TaxID=334426 RepID=A0A158PL69_ANGCS|nr:unnamed protein product [Angiostrongylus costaricensis]